jgi:PKD domain
MRPVDGGRARVRRIAVVLSVVTMLALLAAVAVGRSMLDGDATDADAAASPGPSDSDPAPDPTSAPPSASGSPSAAPRPTTVPAEPWRLVRVGDAVTMATGFTDPGTNDTHRCDFGWDDGAVTSGPAQGHGCKATHVYRHAGMYTITSTVTDDDGGVGRAPDLLVVVYDPAAGQVRGSGGLTAGGDGTFDFTAGYPRPSATEPTGSVTFALPPKVNLNLRNHQHLDWLVVTRDGRTAIKGTAERSPGHQVGFVLYGYHGAGPDRLRIVVWAGGPVPDGAPVLYDSRPGASFDLDRADPQPIDHGAIQT